MPGKSIPGKLILLRHGQSTWNVENLFTGWHDVDLSDKGRIEARSAGVEIKKADPPTKVVDSFKEVAAAQQDAQSAVNRAQAWAQQLTARAQGEAAAFDKVYAQYKLAPVVTRRRMYYETMERVLSQTDKTIVETTGGVQTYLPLPEIKRRAAPAATPAAPQEAPR